MLSRVARSGPVASVVKNSARSHYYLAPDGHPGSNVPFNTTNLQTFVRRMIFFTKFTAYVAIPVWTPWIAMRLHCKKASGM